MRAGCWFQQLNICTMPFKSGVLKEKGSQAPHGHREPAQGTLSAYRDGADFPDGYLLAHTETLPEQRQAQ